MARPKIPYFPFFPKDYLSDLAVRALNAEQCGVLIDLFCWMALSPTYGALYEGENPIPKETVITDLIQPRLVEPKTRDRAGTILEMLLFKRLIRKGLNGALYNQRLIFYLTPKEKFELKGAALTEYLTQVGRIVPKTDFPEYLLEKAGDRRLVRIAPKESSSAENGTPPERSDSQKILDAEIEEARKVHRQIFGKDIKPQEIGLLTYGRNGSRKDCWGSVPVLTAFWKTCAGQEIDDSIAWSRACAKDPTTVARFEKLAFNQTATKRGGFSGIF